MPFKDTNSMEFEAYHIEDDDNLVDSSKCIKCTLDAKYEPVDLNEVVQSQDQLDNDEKDKLHHLLTKHDSLFDGSLGKWTGTQVNLKLLQNAELYHARACPIPRCHMNTLKMEVKYLCEIGVLKKVNQSQWTAPTFVTPKKNGSAHFISDF